MKRLLLLFLFLALIGTTYAQVGVGTEVPEPSAQLDIVSSDKGILIPRVALDSLGDVNTIREGNVESLLVFNTTSNKFISPGYYYWYSGRWRGLVWGGGSSEGGNGLALFYNPTTNSFFYLDEDGNNVDVDFEDYLNETVSTLVVNGDGTFTYTDESGKATTLDVKGEKGADGNGIASTTDNGNGTFTITYTDGSTFTTSDLTGPQGTAGTNGADGTNGTDGNGIASTTDNGDGTFTITYTDGTTFTTSDLTGPQGTAGTDGTNGTDGNGIASTTDNGDGTFTITYTDGSTFTTSDLTGPQGTAGADGADGTNGTDGNGIASTTDNGDGTFTITYTDGSTFTTSDLTGPTGPQGEDGVSVVTGGTGIQVSGDGSEATPYVVTNTEPWYDQSDNQQATSNTDNIYQSGKVGIGTSNMLGTTDDDVALAVNGKILTTSSVYADYVFEEYFEGKSAINKDYGFKSLAEVEKFINENRHLPGITKIDALKQNTNGDYIIDATQLNIQMLEKVEELYLHLIEQKKLMDKKDQEILELKKQTDELNKRLERLEKIIIKNP